jgi:hypothetical protein
MDAHSTDQFSETALQRNAIVPRLFRQIDGFALARLSTLRDR